MEKANTAALEALLGHHFQRPDLLHRALTHSSRAREQEASTGGKIIDNEQLEFLGDAVLGFVTSEELYRRYPEFEEGHLSAVRLPCW